MGVKLIVLAIAGMLAVVVAMWRVMHGLAFIAAFMAALLWLFVNLREYRQAKALRTPNNGGSSNG